MKSMLIQNIQKKFKIMKILYSIIDIGSSKFFFDDNMDNVNSNNCIEKSIHKRGADK